MNRISLTDAAATVERLRCELADARMTAAEASALARTAKKDDAVEAARANAQAKTNVKSLSDALKKAETDLKVAEKQNALYVKEKAESDARQVLAMLDTTTAAFDPFDLNDLDWYAIGRWFAKNHGETVCYVDGTGWGIWTGTHWQFSDTPDAELLNIVRDSWQEKCGNVADKIRSNAQSAQVILEHAKGDMKLARSLFNAPRVNHLVNFANCTLNLKNGVQKPHDPKDYMTGRLQCNYNPKANVQRIYDAFARFWPNDPACAKQFQVCLGYSMTAEVSAKRMFFMVGNQDESDSNGNNGKSMVQNALTAMFGVDSSGVGTSVKSALIIDTGDRDANSHDGAKYPLVWRRFSMSSEFRKGASVNAGEFNNLSGGDMQPVRLPHAKETVNFVNYCSMWFSMNSVPRFKTWDKATKQRLTPFPFNETFHDPKNCPPGGQPMELGLKEWLEGEGEGREALALYAVIGAREFYDRNGGVAGQIEDSPSVIAMREKILTASNPFADFFDDMFEADKMWDVSESAVNKLLRNHLGYNPKPYEKDSFVAALKGIGVIPVKIKGYRFYRGIKLTQTAKQDPSVASMKDYEQMRGSVVRMAAE